MCFTLHSTVGALLMFHKPNTKKERKKERKMLQKYTVFTDFEK